MNFQFPIFKQSKGFTLIEILIVLFIIAFLSAVLLIGRSSGEKKLALDRMAYQLSQDIREVQKMVMGAEEFDCGEGVLTYSFGLYFEDDWIDRYVIFADCNSNQERDSADSDIRQFELEEGINISALSPSSPLDIVFGPPDPMVYINGENWGQDAQISISFDSSIKNVKLNSAGRVERE